ncbi:MAG: DUF4159 domain-containing protein [Ignavibacteriae bacterium]|nr:DUF4159 domain-containing protein [Ignavibacteria bacterium]MBI3364089.1 DUF4159 domain-containing protein [Ignavibacteriota bacterium]
MRVRFTIIITVVLLLSFDGFSQAARPSSSFKIARLKYSGGGDWYNDPQEETNLLKFIRQNTLIDVDPVYEFVDITSEKFFTYPFVFLTGHGNMAFTDLEVKRLRTYLENGGFIYADDDYGMDKAFRREIKKVFPDQELMELPFSFGLYHSHYDFPNGAPKTHEHDGKPAQGFGLFHSGRLVLYYTYESNPSDGWNDPEVHGDPPEKREEALRFGTNIVVWALTH